MYRNTSTSKENIIVDIGESKDKPSNLEIVMKKVAENRWINAKNIGATTVVTVSPAEYILLSQTKPENMELKTIEEAVFECL